MISSTQHLPRLAELAEQSSVGHKAGAVIESARVPRQGQPDRPRVLFLMPAGFSVRNVVHSGLLDRLLPSAEAILLVQQVDEQVTRILGRPGVMLHEFQRTQSKFLLRKLQSIQAEAHSVRYNSNTYRIFGEWRRRNWGWKEKLKSWPFDTAGALFSREPFYRLLRRVVDHLRYSKPPIQFARDFIASTRPSLVVSTYNVFSVELPYVLAAREAGIPVVAHILSFDNLTSRGVIPVIHDEFLVWNERMRDELLALYPHVQASQVVISGTPQFDFHVRKEFQSSREETAARFDLDAQRSWLLYAGNHSNFTPTEPELVEQIFHELAKTALGEKAQLIVRLHPMDNPARWDRLFQRLPQIKRSLPWDENLQGRTDIATLDNQRCLVSLLRHSAVCMAMASTMSLDASVLGTPSIGIGYASQPGSVEDNFYRKSYQTEHYAPLIASGGITLVTSHRELIGAIQQYVAQPGTNRDQREKMVKAECGPLDGRSTERIAAFLLSRLKREKHL